MQYSTSYLNVNGVWREVLILSDTKPIPDFQNNVITHTQGDYETIYYTDGLYRSTEESGTFYNQYVIVSKVVRGTNLESLKKDVTSLAEAVLNLQFENDMGTISPSFQK